jgi:hypothetical protein
VLVDCGLDCSTTFLDRCLLDLDNVRQPSLVVVNWIWKAKGFIPAKQIGI